MISRCVVCLSCFVALVGGSLVPSRADQARAEDIVARYVEAHGGSTGWRNLQAIALRGTYSAFSKRSAFTLIRQRGDRYRLDFTMLGDAAVRARDDRGPWMLNTLLDPAPSYVTEGPYRSQLERESLFPLVLLDHERRGLGVAVLGEGEVDGVATLDLEIGFADGRKEIWHLDPQTWLEIAIDSEVYDHTQSTEPMVQRTFFSDFRRVGDLLIPFVVEYEFGARLESMTVESVEIDPELDAARFSLEALVDAE